jgi:hypothetical protein
MTCLDCNQDTATEHLEQLSFLWKGTNKGIEFYAVVPVMRCSECNFGWTDYRAEDILDNIVQEWLRGS